ncbi:WD repeat-containing protein 44-like [Gigantopelta aegis]|uniref:WD repeat-containing protein 44-like n=1 Tax=Gigantopelta aegis TaxID=1735272 RepID=UPI001B88AC20|nr:WD repeat-containing protein 44-like [Gigantopelta aegis]
MDSDSDSDEFYDAEDHSIDSFISSKSRGILSLSSLPSSKNLSFIQIHHTHTPDITEEERLLLELKKKAVEKWQREDEELERRLHELQKKKVTEDSKTEEAHTQMQELEIRRRKLEEMRQLIREESMTLRHAADSSPEEDVVEEEILQVIQSSPHKKSHTIEKMEHSYQDTKEHLYRRHSRKKRSGSWGDLPHNTSVIVGESETESSMTPKEGTSVKRSQSGRSKLLTLRHGSSDDDDDESHCELEAIKVVDDVMYDSRRTVMDGQRTATDGPQSVKDGSLPVKDSVMLVNAPDIVMSTKPRTSSAEFSLPVAPPRRKKSTNQASTSHQRSSVDVEIPSLSSSVSLPVDNSDKGLGKSFQCLELRDVIRGSKMVTSEAAEVNAVKPHGSSCDSQLPYITFEDPTDEEINGGSDDDRVHKKRKKDRLRRSSGDKCRSPSPVPTSPDQNISQLGCDLSKTDVEILDCCLIKNLDTGEELPLSKAAEELPQCINPVDLHIVQRTKEYKGDSLHPDASTDEDTISFHSSSSSAMSLGSKKKRLKKLLSRTARKVKNVADQVLFRDEGDTEEEVSVDGKIFKIKSSNSNKGPYDFAQIRMLQELSGEHVGAIWSMKFSACGRLLATGGQDGILKIWVLKSAYVYFTDLRKKYEAVSLSPATSVEDLTTVTTETASSSENPEEEDEDESAPFKKTPFCCYRGHAADLLDVSWSKNYFILSSSMDKTVRLWHMSRRECLCTFQHIDFVTTIVFHPKDDRYFLSGSLDGKLRLWNIPDKKVTLWNEVGQTGSLITTANFVSNGKYAVVGTYDGRCIFYTTEQLKYFTQIHVRSTRGRNAKGQKITGIEPVSDSKMLVTSNDSRIRLYDLRDLTLSVKYKGGTNTSSQIKASLSPTGKYIVCGSEDHFIYIWKTRHDYKLSATRRDRNDYWEAIKVHNAVATVAIFAPNPSLFCPPVKKLDPCAASIASCDLESGLGEIIISADFTGAIKVVRNYPQKL